MFSNVVVGIGGGEGWHDALALAKQLLREGGRLTLANVFVLGAEPHLSSGYSRDIEALERARAAELLQRARVRAGVAAGARWRGAASVARGLHEIAETLGADLLVVGMSGHGLLDRALLRDNTLAALHGAPCAVAVAPAGYGRRANEIQRVRVFRDSSAEQFASASGSDELLVVGSHGHGPLRRLQDRATHRKLVHHASSPLLVLPRGSRPLAVAEALAYGEDPVEAGLR
jgi:nucleotide-binding universal stress UspA family protein